MYVSVCMYVYYIYIDIYTYVSYIYTVYMLIYNIGIVGYNGMFSEDAMQGGVS